MYQITKLEMEQIEIGNYGGQYAVVGLVDYGEARVVDPWELGRNQFPVKLVRYEKIVVTGPSARFALKEFYRELRTQHQARFNGKPVR